MLDAPLHTRLDADQQAAATAYDRCQAPCGSRPPWCVAATHPRAERRAHAELHRRGFHVYLPLITVRWADRTWHTVPAFPRYLFVRLDLTKPWNPVRYAPGVYSLVSFNDKPATCSDTVVEAVRSALHAAKAVSAPEHAWKPGTPCSLALGPLAGMPAIVTQVGHDMATVAVMMLGHLREVAVQLNAIQPRTE
jgi:transcription antitermination factor NusG